ncbi:MAG TPA: SRPBCC family protein, partial [Longimicrobium sp.]
VFQALTDLEGAARWMPGIAQVERVGEVREGVGSRWRETRVMRGKEVTEELEVTHHHPPSHLTLRIDGTRGTSGRGTYVFDYHLAQRVGGTEVRMNARIDGSLPPMLGWMGPLLAPLIKRECARDLRALAQHLRETEGAAAAS